MQSIMERRHIDLLDTIEPKNSGPTRVKTTSFHTTDQPESRLPLFTPQIDDRTVIMEKKNPGEI
jgi:hypothetical protein